MADLKTLNLDNVPTLVGDSGSGGTKGLVPAPAAGDTAAGKFLKADGTFAIPAGTGANTSLSNLSGTAVNTTLSSTGAQDLGAGISPWGTVYAIDTTLSGTLQAGTAINGTFLTASRALTTDGSKNIVVSAVTSTELGFVGGVTSAIQTQFTGKANLALSNLASLAINTSLLPGTTNSIDLGSASKTFANAFIQGVIHNGTQTVIDPSASQLKSGSTAKLDWSATDVSLNTRKLTNVVDPTSAQDAATKAYADTKGTGSVTSVAATVPGGFAISGSPITTSGTLAITASGTSGGVLYYSSATTTASSGALTANTLVLGGGAGAAPTSLGAGTTTTILHGNASGAPTFSAVSLTADVSGTLPIANGGTGQTTANPAFNALSPLTTKGDVLSYSTVNARVPIGTDGQVLTADSTQALGLKWAAAGGTGTVTSVALSVPASSIFSVTGSPVTTSGTLAIATAGTAGGIPYFSSTSALSSTGAGTAQQWILSGGTGIPTMSNTTTTGKFVDGSADEIQMRVQGHSTQTSVIFDVEKSDGTALLQTTNTAGTFIKGTTTNDSASAGGVGELISSVVSSATNFPGSGSYGDLTSISLTAGDWDVSVLIVAQANGATVTSFDAGISSTSGNSSTGLVTGDNSAETSGPNAASFTTLTIPPYRVSLSATTTYYLKYTAAFSVATPRAVGRISARRIR